MELPIFPLVMVLNYLAEYVVALYALAVYIDPDELETLFPKLARRRKSLFKMLISEPRIFLQVLAVFRAFVLIVNTSLMLLFLRALADEGGSVDWYIYPMALFLVWVLHIFFVEYLPRRTSRKAIERARRRHIWVLAIVYIFFQPLVRLYRWGLSRATEEGVTEEQKEEIVERAIESLADQAGIADTIIEEEEKEMIGSIFQLDTTVAREIMVPRVDIVGIPDDASFARTREIVGESGYSRFPVYANTIDTIIGVLYVKDLVTFDPAQEHSFHLRHLVRRAYFVHENKVIRELLREFRTEKVHIAIVADEYGGVSGLVTLEDVLEEIVGEIRDEHDTEEDLFTKIDENSFLVSAAILLDDLQNKLDVEYEGDEESDTLGGLIYALVGAVPEPGARVTWHDLELEVDEVEGQRIKRVKVTVKENKPALE